MSPSSRNQTCTPLYSFLNSGNMEFSTDSTAPHLCDCRLGEVTVNRVGAGCQHAPNAYLEQAGISLPHLMAAQKPPSQGQSSALPPGTPYQWELVGHPAIRGQLGAKAKGREHLVAVVVLDDFPDGRQRQRVGIQLVGAHVVQ